MSSRMFAITHVAILILFGIICSPAPSVAAETINLRVGLPSYLSSNWPLYAAVKGGFFREEKINAELIVMRRSTLQIQALISEDLQVSQNSVDSAARAFEAGAPLKFIGSAQQKPTFRLIVDPSIKGWADLKGQVLATGAPGGVTYAMLLAMLDVNGIKKDTVKLLSMGTSNDRSHALRVKRVRGTLLSAPDDFNLLDEGFKSLGFVGDYLKELEYNGYVVNDNWAKRNEQSMIRFMRAMIKATKWLHDPTQKDRAIKILGEYIPFKPQWLESVYEMLIQNKMLSTDCRPSPIGIQNTIQLSIKYGTGLSSVPPVNSWVDLRYLDKATATLN